MNASRLCKELPYERKLYTLLWCATIDTLFTWHYEVYVNGYHIIWRERKTDMTKPNNSFGNTFVSVELSNDQDKQFDSWYEDNLPDMQEWVTNVLNDGYKLSVSYHDDSDMVIVTLSGKPEQRVNGRCSMTTWGRDFFEGVMLACYKHFVVCDGGTWADYAVKRKRG